MFAEGAVSGESSEVAGARSQAGEPLLEQARTLVESAYMDAVDDLPARLRFTVGYHTGWWDERGRRTRHRGKALRPALVVASFSAAGQGAAENCVPEAVAVEAVHDFSLLHDDLMDGDNLRRNRAAAWSVFGYSTALLAGDALLALAVNMVADRESMGVLARALTSLCRGQSADLDLEGRDDFGLDECLAMIADKTGALFSSACEMGAVAAGAAPEVCRSLALFGHHLGIAYQFADDILGIWGDVRATGKPTGSDLARRKKNPLIVAALTSDTPAGRRLQDLYGSDRTDSAVLSEIAHLVDVSGARVWATATAHQHCRTARRYLDDLPTARSAELTALADVISRRLPIEPPPS